MLRHEPEIFGALGILIVIGQTASLRTYTREAWRLYRRPFGVAFFQMAVLSGAMIKDGAPTHHPERALLVMLLLCALLVGNLGAILWPRMNRAVRTVSTTMTLGVLLLSLIIVRRWFRGEDFTVRQDEVATGDFARHALPAGERILVDVVDYGYFAFIAALGRPEDAVLDRDLDPRKSQHGSSFDDSVVLRRKMDETHVRWIVADITRPAVKNFGSPQFVHGKFGVWREDSWK
jgi:hypothetical protein